MRLEYKYLVDVSKTDALRKALSPYITFDSEYNDKPEYTVRSIYFDTSQLTYYHEKIEGLKIRKKLRIRGYNQVNDNSVIFLEIKRKNENYIGKNRSALKFQNLEEFIRTKDYQSYILSENGYAGSSADAEKFLHHIYKQSLKPVVLVSYDREAYFSKFDNRLRLTFDKNIRYMMFPSMDQLYDDNDLKQAMPKYFIFEVKFRNGFPVWLSSILTKFNLSRMALSKYTICLDHEKPFKPSMRRSLIGCTETFAPFHLYHED